METDAVVSVTPGNSPAACSQSAAVKIGAPPCDAHVPPAVTKVKPPGVVGGGGGGDVCAAATRTPHPPPLPPHASSSSSRTAHRSRAGSGVTAADRSSGASCGTAAVVDAGAAAVASRDAKGGCIRWR